MELKLLVKTQVKNLNVMQISLNHNNITDICPLTRRAALKKLCISYNSISDVSVLQGLTRISYLEIDSNDISINMVIPLLEQGGAEVIYYKNTTNF